MQGWQPPPGGYGAPPPGGFAPPPAGPPGYPGGPYGQPQIGYGAPGPVAMGGGGYEFGPNENAVIDRCAGRMKVWGVVSIVVGSLTLLLCLPAFLNPIAGVMLLSTGGVMLAVGISFVKAAASFQMAVQTQGSDIPHLLQGIDKLGGAFLTQTICVLIAVVLNIILLIIGVILFAAAFASAFSR